ncbi:hypothetical protein GALMADRAFT_1248600 [Galerina marginata CBS 339.88]|uniref:F-box domain-containing protein n=1 Tax=Galerina marginata (strain CBS 339.88) TaxID=685588 RepID=A0A067SD57_GALM3|nr:hypothetical protein GALMADRAFT_1248600 [Galerina marginata CBS 339.88]
MESVNTTQNQRLGSESPSQTNSPITTLHHDIHREIFLSNANIFAEKKCLETTRLSSQVCHTWRSHILNSPTIWGRLLELSALERCTEQWREEVLRRSGDSLLWIYGHASGSFTYPRIGTKFFYRILNTYWERIEHLSMTTMDLPIDEELWQPLLRPAPFLQSFSVVPLGLRRVVNHFPASNFNTPSSPLFSDHAPVLRKFCTNGFAFSLTSPWLADLCNLHLFHPVSVSEILNALRSTPFLTTLAISGTAERSLDSESSLPSVILANLTSLTFTDIWLPHVTKFITHIRPTNGCSLFCTSEFSSNVNEDLRALSRPLSRWFQSYLRNNHVTNIRLDLGI